MRRRLVWLGVLLAGYAASGLYIVRGNEQALVRRFGRARLPLAGSGLHLDLPWPFTRIDRVNVHQAQNLTIGVAPGDPLDGGGFLREVNLDRQGEFLTGDKNILNLSVSIQYRIDDPLAYHCQSREPDAALARLVESVVTDAVSRSGVDFVHPLGLTELREFLTREARRAAERQPWGLTVEDVTIASALPPVEVKAAFLDVSNARAEKDRGIHQAEARAEKRVAAATALADERRDRARAAAMARVESAKGSADRFLAIVAEFQASAADTDGPAAARRRTMQRLFTAAMEQLLPRLSGKVLVDPSDPVDLTIFPPPEPARPGGAGGAP